MTAPITTHSATPASSNDVRRRVDALLEDIVGRRAADVAQRGPFPELQALRSFALGGGKRMRAILCYWGWRGAGGPDDSAAAAITAGAALELFHAFTLIQDDIIDGSDTRRGRPAMHRQLAMWHERENWQGTSGSFGAWTAIVLGDLCQVWADELLDSCSQDLARVDAVRRAYDRMRTGVICGEYLELVEQARKSFSTAQYLVVAREKAAPHIVGSLQVGAALAGGSPELRDAYAAFGTPLGEAYQLRDDVLGVLGDPQVTGKPVSDDLREGKPTALMAWAFQHATPIGRDRIKVLYGQSKLDESGARELRDILRTTGAVAAIGDLVEARTREALTAIRKAPITDDARRALTEVATTATGRQW